MFSILPFGHMVKADCLCVSCPFGISFTFHDNIFNLFYKLNYFGIRNLSYDLYKIFLQDEAINNYFHIHVGTKICIILTKTLLCYGIKY